MRLIEKLNPIRIIEKMYLLCFWQFYIQKNPFYKAYCKVLELKSNNPLLTKIENKEERALPSDARFQKSGWWKKMILRYGIASRLSKNKRVLDTCCGIGWGSYLVAQLALKVTSIDLDESSINFAKEYWKEFNLNFEVASVLNIPFQDSSFDVVLAIESIEHFSQEEGVGYLTECHRVLRKGGIIFGSSYFPSSREEANRLSSNNQYHLYIYTKNEIKDLLKKKFSKTYVFKNRSYFIAKK